MAQKLGSETVLFFLRPLSLVLRRRGRQGRYDIIYPCGDC